MNIFALIISQDDMKGLQNHCLQCPNWVVCDMPKFLIDTLIAEVVCARRKAGLEQTKNFELEIAIIDDLMENEALEDMRLLPTVRRIFELVDTEVVEKE
jgi:hypothetical protein